MIELAIVGCGRVTRIAHLDALSKLSKYYRISAVCDIIPQAADTVAPQAGAKAYYDYAALLKDKPFDLLVLNVANGLHVSMALQAIEMGVKAVAIEKPLAMDLKSADRLIEAAKSAGVRLFTILQNRYNPPVRRVKEALAAGRFGRLLSAQVSMFWHREKSYYEGPLAWHADANLAGGVFTNQSVHYLDLLLWLSDQKPLSVAALMGHRFGLEVEDYGSAIVGFDGGLIAGISVSNHAQGADREGSLTLIGETGMVKIGGKALNRLELWAFDTPLPGDENVFSTASEPPTVYGFGHFDFYKNVADCLESNHCENTVNAQEGRRSVELLKALYQSALQKQMVLLD